MKKTLLITLSLALVATAAFAADLTTYQETGNDRVARFLVNLGREYGNTMRGNNEATSVLIDEAGLFDDTRRGGNAAASWIMNDGDLAFDRIATFTHDDTPPFVEVGPEWIGYKFKAPATVESLLLQDNTFFDGGAFTNVPDVEVLTGSRNGTWQVVPATFDTPYLNYNNRTGAQFNITLDTPAVDVWGVRLIGPAQSPMADNNGFLSLIELRINGTASGFANVILTNNVAQDADATPVMSSEETPGTVGLIADGSVAQASIATTKGGTAPDHIGVTWTTTKQNIGAIGWTMRINNDGGWLEDGTVDVEYLDPADSTWKSVAGLDTTVYDMTLPALTNNQQVITQGPPTVGVLPLDTGFLFTFNPVPNADGIRITGTSGGTGTDPDGYISALEFEVFRAVPEPGMLIGGVALLFAFWRKFRG